MIRRVSVFSLSLIAQYLLAMWLGPAVAAHPPTTYNDPSGKFSIDPPESWNLVPKVDENTYIFKRSGPEQFIVAYAPGTWEPASIFSLALNIVKNSVAEAAPEGEVLDLQVNGNSARWGIYRGKVQRVTLYCLVGAVVLKDGGVEFIAILNEGTRKKWAKDLEATFRTIRNAPGPSTGVPEATPASGGESAKKVEPAQPSPSTPKIRVMDPPFKPDETLVEVTMSPLTVRGAAMDERGIQSVEINGQRAMIKSSGDIRSVEFALTDVALQEGLNRVTVVATNVDKQKTELTLPLWLRKPASAPSARKGLTEAEITDLLKNSVRPRRVEDLARSRGIAFDVTSEAEDRLRRAGADDGLVQTLRDLSGKSR